VAVAAIVPGRGVSGAVAEFAVTVTLSPRSAPETWTPICAGFEEALADGLGTLANAAGGAPDLTSGGGCMLAAALASSPAVIGAGARLMAITVTADVIEAPNHHEPLAGAEIAMAGLTQDGPHSVRWTG
jgi:hypothetical protein